MADAAGNRPRPSSRSRSEIRSACTYTRPRRWVLAPADRRNPVAQAGEARQGGMQAPLRRSAAVRGRDAGRRWRRWGTRGRHERSKCWPAVAARLGLGPPARLLCGDRVGVGAHLTRCCAETIQCAGLTVERALASCSSSRRGRSLVYLRVLTRRPQAATVPFHHNS